MSAPRKFSVEEQLNLERNAGKILGMTPEQARYMFIEKRSADEIYAFVASFHSTPDNEPKETV